MLPKTKPTPAGVPRWGAAPGWLLLLLALPGLALAAVSPFTVRLMSLLSDDEHVGISAGSVAMASTFG